MSKILVKNKYLLDRFLLKRITNFWLKNLLSNNTINVNNTISSNKFNDTKLCNKSTKGIDSLPLSNGLLIILGPGEGTLVISGLPYEWFLIAALLFKFLAIAAPPCIPTVTAPLVTPAVATPKAAFCKGGKFTDLIIVEPTKPPALAAPILLDIFEKASPTALVRISIGFLGILNS